MPGKIVHGGIAESIRNLGEIEILGTDQLFGGVYLHICKKFHDAAVVPLAENPDEPGVADEIVLTDPLKGQLRVEVLFQIGDELLIESIFGSIFFGKRDICIAGYGLAAPDEMQQKLF